MNLDDDLAAWAAAVRLPALEADAIFRRVVNTPVPVATTQPGLDPSWWREFNAGFATRMIASTRPAHRRAALARINLGSGTAAHAVGQRTPRQSVLSAELFEVFGIHRVSE
jgi:hypothetical protein